MFIHSALRGNGSAARQNPSGAVGRNPSSYAASSAGHPDPTNKTKTRRDLRLTGPGRGTCDPPANRTPLTAHREWGRCTVHHPHPFVRSDGAGVLLAGSRSALGPLQGLRPSVYARTRLSLAPSDHMFGPPGSSCPKLPAGPGAASRRGRVEVAGPRPVGSISPVQFVDG